MLNLHYCFPFSYRSSNFALPTIAIAIVAALFESKGETEKYRKSYRYHLYVRARATTIAIAINWWSEYYRKEIKGKKQSNYSKNQAIKIESDNFPSSNREKSNIAIKILKKKKNIRKHHNYYTFWGHQ